MNSHIVGAVLVGALITLHTPSGRELFTNADEIMVIGDPEPAHRLIKGCSTAVTVHDRVLCVRETPAQVKQLVESAKQ